MIFPRRHPRSRSLFLIGAFLACMAMPADATAATFNVTKTADTADGTCNADCSLREAISAANATAGTLDVVKVPAGTYTLTGAANEDMNASGDLDVRSILRIEGASRTTTIIDGANLDRVMHVHSASLVLDGLTLRHGAPPSGNGGGLLVDSNLSQSLFDTAFVDNVSTGNGGGLWLRGSNVQLNHVEVAGNSAAGDGGGAFVTGPTSGTWRGSSVHDNVAGADGGGLVLNGALELTGVTFHANTAGGEGGAISKQGAAAASVVFGTFSANVTDSDHTLTDARGGAFDVAAGSLTFSDSLFVGNVARTGAGTTAPSVCGADGGATVTSLGYNVTTSSAGCGAGIFGDPTDQIVADAGVEPFGTRGGNGLPIVPITLDSPALDAAPSPRCTGLNSFSEGRGGRRNDLADACDAGAFELGGVGDLVGALTLPAGGAEVGRPVTVSATSTLQGPDVSPTGGLLLVILPSGAQSISAPSTADHSCSVNGLSVTCTRRPMQPGSAIDASVTFTPTIAGSSEIGLETEAWNDDNLDNGYLTATLTVRPATDTTPPPTDGGPGGGPSGGGDPAPTPPTPPTPTPPTPTPPTPPDKAPPLVTKVSFAANRFLASAGTKLRLTLDEPSVVSGEITQRVPGRKVGTRCVPGTKPSTAKPCVAVVLRGTLKANAKPGANAITFRYPRLKPGLYTLTFKATDFSGNSSKPKQLVFVVAPARP